MLVPSHASPRGVHSHPPRAVFMISMGDPHDLLMPSCTHTRTRDIICCLPALDFPRDHSRGGGLLERRNVRVKPAEDAVSVV
jgi:hypothetical protein